MYMEKIILTLLNIPGVGVAKARKMQSQQELYCDHNGIIDNKLQKALKEIINFEVSIEEIKTANIRTSVILNHCRKYDIEVLINEHIPTQLRNYKDSPLVVYVRGNKTLFKDESIITIIGSRNPTKKGVEAANKISKYISHSDDIILSGLALGVDTIAHKAAVSNKRPTIAVLGSGLNNIYPKENKLLSEEIIDCDGALISIYAPDTDVQRYQLVERDKIQARLSDSLILVQSKINGGSMHATKEAIKRAVPLYTVDYNDEPTHTWDGNKSIINNKSLGVKTLNFKNLENDLSKINLKTKFTVGDYIKHPKKPEWGDGKILDVRDGIYEIDFEKVKEYKNIKIKEAKYPFIKIKDKELLDLLIPCLGYYISDRLVNNDWAQFHTEFKKKIHAIKDNDDTAIKKYGDQVLKIIDHNNYYKYLSSSIICTAPSHDLKKIDTGISEFAKYLALNSNNNFIYEENLLKRIKTIRKSSTAGYDRPKIEDHLESIEINVPLTKEYYEENISNKIEGKNILLIDDIKTTGATLDACTKKLSKYKPNKIIIMCLAETIQASDGNDVKEKKQDQYYKEKIQKLNNIKLK